MGGLGMGTFAKDFLGRGLQVALTNGSSTRIPVIWLGFGVLMLGFVLTVGIEWLTGGRNMPALETALKSWKSWLGAALALTMAWLLLFVYSVFEVAYADHKSLVIAESKTCPVEVKQQEASPKTKPGEKPKIAVTINQGKGSTANPGVIVAPIKQGDCGVVQNGGSNNSASPTCAPPVRKLTDVQKQGIGNFLKSIPLSVQVSVGSVYGSGDAALYAGEFFPLFGGRHLENQDGPVIRTGFPATFVGVIVATPTEDDPASPYRDELVDKLNSLGINAKKANGSKVPIGNIELVIGYRSEDVGEH
jgi:hypothetical protein